MTESLLYRTPCSGQGGTKDSMIRSAAVCSMAASSVWQFLILLGVTLQGSVLSVNAELPALVFRKVPELDGYVPSVAVGSVSSTTLLKCCALCLRTADCRSLFFNKGGGACRLSQYNHWSSEWLTGGSTGWQFYRDASAVPLQCPDDAVTQGYQSASYYELCVRLASVTSGDVTRQEARDKCVTGGGELIKLDSLYKLQRLRGLFQHLALYSGMSQYTRVEGNRKDGAGLWDFDLDTEVKLPFGSEVSGVWAAKQPNDYQGVQACLGLEPHVDLGLHDIECATSILGLNSFICEVPLYV